MHVQKLLYVRAIIVQSTLASLTLEGEDLVPPRVEVLPLDTRRQLALLVRQQHDLQVGVARARHVVHDRQVDGTHDLQGQGHVLGVVLEAELNASLPLAARVVVGGQGQVVPRVLLLGRVAQQAQRGGARASWPPCRGRRPALALVLRPEKYEKC